MKWLWLALLALFAAGSAVLWWPKESTAESCDAPPWELLDAARRDEASSRTTTATPSVATPGTTAHGAPSTRAAAPTLGTGATTAPRGDAQAVPAMPPGKGTESEPFRVGWELLGRADGHVTDDGGLRDLPRTLELLRGSWVELNGYFAPAIIAPSTDEVLIMKNRWDGCCIGLPPTAFDSVLAKTRAPVDFSKAHQIRFSTIRGRLVVEPLAMGGFVLGLYRLDDAEFLR